MSWQLMHFVGPIIGPLQEMQGQFEQFTARHRDAQNALLSSGTSLTNAGGLDLFAGDGAASFSNAIAQYISDSSWHMQVLDQAVSATSACANSVWEAAAIASSVSLDDGLLSQVLAQITLDDIIQNGSDPIIAIINDMKNTLGNMASTGGDFFGNLIHGNIGGAINDVGQEFNDAGHLVSDLMGLLDDILSVLCQWAQSIFDAVKGWIEAIISYIQALFFYRPHVTKGTPNRDQQNADQAFNRNPNMLTLYGKINAQEENGNKIGIEQIGPNTILVTLAGTDPGDPQYPTNLPDALDSGAGDRNNPYLLDIEAAIEQYIQEHHLPPGTQVVVAGHSLGGIEAQYLAENNGTTNYTVTQVITYGSPQIGPPVKGVQYEQYFNRYDPITLMSWYEMGPIAQELGVPAALAAAYLLDTGPGQNKANFIHETLVPGNPNGMPAHPSLQDLLSLKDHQYINDTWLQTQNFTVNGTTLKSINVNAGYGQTEYYVGTPQNQAADWTRFGIQAVMDFNIPLIPGLQPISSPW